MIIVSTENIAGYEIPETLGIAMGNIVRARNIGRDIFAGLKNIVGGEISEYSNLLEQSRFDAAERMTKHAQSLGADAIINVRYTTSTVMQGCSEILAYGTAVKIRKI
jgi:uncharacterized protein YbjQ (UPF0145 family)